MHELAQPVLCVMAGVCRDHGKYGKLKFACLPRGGGATFTGKKLNAEGAGRGTEVC